MIDDGWTRHIYPLFSPEMGPKDEFGERLGNASLVKMDYLRARVDSIVKDKRDAEGLKAWYGHTCKRPCFNDDYLDSFNLPNVHLVHTDGQGVSEITEKGAVANNVEHELDCIIYATGFDWGNDYSARANMTITGRHGVTMSEKWKGGPSTLFGMLGRDFPNLCLITHLQSSTSSNYTYLLRERARLAAYLIRECTDRGLRSIEPTQEAEDAWVKKLEDIAIKHLAHFQLCTPGKSDTAGQPPSVRPMGTPPQSSLPVRQYVQWLIGDCRLPEPRR